MASLQDIQQILQEQGAAQPPPAGPPAQGLTPVIDVTPTARPSAAPGEPGSQLAPTLVNPAATPTPAGTMAVPMQTVAPNATDGSRGGVADKMTILQQATQGTLTAAPGDPAFDVKPGQKTGYMANIGAGTSEGVANTLGMPVDVLTAVMNAGAKALGLPPIKDPIGGSESFHKLFGLIGANPEDVVPGDQGQRLARAAAEGATANVLPGGVASKLVRAGVTTAAPALEALAAGSGIGGAAAGAGSGVGSEITQELVPDQYKPLAAMAGGVAGTLPVVATQAAANAARATVADMASRAVRRNTDQMAGNVLLQRAGAPAGPVPPIESAPVAGMPLDLAQASNNPGLASHVRLTNQIEPNAANVIRSGQNAAVERAATTTQGPGATQLASGVMSPADASTALVEATQRASGILKEEADRLWTRPELANKEPAMPELRARVARTINALPQRVKAAIGNSADLRAAIDYLLNLPNGSTLPDVNQARSDILEISRSLPFSERFAKRAAEAAAEAVLKAIEENPALRSDPVAWRAYQDARRFTAKMWETLGKPQFQQMLEAGGVNRRAIDPGTVSGKLYNFSRGTERTPGGVTQITDLLGNVEKQWQSVNLLGRLLNMIGGPGTSNLINFDPAAVTAAKNELAQASRDFIINSMLDAASATTRDVAGEQNTIMNRLSNWIDTNKQWMKDSGQFNQDQIDLLENIRKAAVMAGRTENLRGGPGSPTYELLKGDRFVDAFIGPLLGRAITTTGGLAMGALATIMFGETGIGSMIGAELAGGGVGHASQSLLQRFYSKPREEIMQKLKEAASDPQLAHDLMMKANSANVARMRPATKVWLRLFLGAQPAQAAALAAAP